jgi:CheY-like chemotaxis protein
MLSSCAKEQKKARLLCVDDDLGFLVGFTAVLESAGYCVVATNDPRQGFELATNGAFDLVIVDYDMPYMNGGELAFRLKQHRRDLPIILFSGSDSVPLQAINGVDDHLVKGEGVKTLLQTVGARFPD